MSKRSVTLLPFVIMLASCAQPRFEGSFVFDGAASKARRSIAVAELPRETLRAELLERGQSGTFFQNARNGDHLTWRAADDTALVLQDGLLTATFGFGFDLLSADVSETLASIARRQNGIATRIHRYLNGENQIFTRAFRCDVMWKGDIGERKRITETCSGANITFENDYVLAADGRIISSRQWLGPEIGSIRLSLREPGVTGPIIAVAGN